MTAGNPESTALYQAGFTDGTNRFHAVNASLVDDIISAAREVVGQWDEGHQYTDTVSPSDLDTLCAALSAFDAAVQTEGHDE